MSSKSNDFQRLAMEESDSYSRMDKKRGDRNLKLLLLLAAATAFIVTVMVFVIFGYQQRRCADVEKSMRSPNCSVNFEINSGSEPDKNPTELRNMVSSLNLTFSSLITNNQHSNGVQTKAFSDLQTLLNALSSSLSSLSAKLDTKLQDMDSQKSMLSEINTSVSKLTSSVDSLSSKLQNTDERVAKLLPDLSDLMTKQKNDNKPVSLCKSEWIQFQSKCYFFSKMAKNWNEAQKYCRTENGMLVKVETDEELAFLTIRQKQYWVGLTDETTAQWRWDDGSPFLRNAKWWSEGQPDNWDGHGLGGGEDCAHLTTDGELNDSHCSSEMQFICQI